MKKGKKFLQFAFSYEHYLHMSKNFESEAYKGYLHQIRKVEIDKKKFLK